MAFQKTRGIAMKRTKINTPNCGFTFTILALDPMIKLQNHNSSGMLQLLQHRRP